MKKYYRLLGWLIPVVILGLTAAFFILPDQTYSKLENRNLQTFPDLTWNTVTNGRFEERFDTYVEDQFPLRQVFVRLKGIADRCLGRTEANGVYMAEDGYLIQKFDGPDEKNLEETLNTIGMFHQKYADIPQYMLLAPTALTVLKDRLPYGASWKAEGEFMDRVRDRLRTAGVPFVDTRETFSALSDEKQLYYRTDHHWTTDGAWAAYNVFRETADLVSSVSWERRPLTDTFSGTLTARSGFRMTQTDTIWVYIPRETEEVRVTRMDSGERTQGFYALENLEKRDQYTVFLGGNAPEIRIQTEAGTGRVLLVLKDSYANCFLPFLEADFDTIVVIDPRYYNEDLDEVIQSKDVTDILYLYNAQTFAADTSLKIVLEGALREKNETDTD